MSRAKCCVPGCTINSKPNHRFPNPEKDTKRFEQWRSAIQCPTLFAMEPQNIYDRKKVCHCHFEEKYFQRGPKRIYLFPNAVPTLFFGEHVSSSEESLLSVQNDVSDSDENKQNDLKDITELELEQSVLSKMKIEVENDSDAVLTREKDICTFCLDECRLQYVTNPPLNGKLSHYNFIEAEIGYKLPELLCRECFTRLNGVVSFVEKCKYSIAEIIKRNGESDIDKKHSPVEIVYDETDVVQDLQNEIYEPSTQMTDIGPVVIATGNEQAEIIIPDISTNELYAAGEWECPVQEEYTYDDQEEYVNEVHEDDNNVVQEVVHEVQEEYINAIQENGNAVQREYLIGLQGEQIDEKQEDINAVQEEYINTVQEEYINGIHEEGIDEEQKYMIVYQEEVAGEIEEEGINVFQEVVDQNTIQSENSENQLYSPGALVDHSYDTKRECPKCHETVSRLDSHYKLNENCRPKKIRCSMCSSSFSNRDEMILHQKQCHLNEANGYGCRTCSKTFKSVSSLDRHIRVHKYGKRYMCEQCGKNYTTASQLQDHQNSHLNIKPYKCPDCGKQFSVKSGLYLHRRVHNKSNNANTEDTTSSKNTEDKPLEESKPVPCPICFRFFVGHGLKMHMHTHNEDKVYKCTKCNTEREFPSISDYRKHLKTHAVKDCRCSFCGKMFSRATLRQHIKIHTEKCAFSCDPCEKLFRTRRHLITHCSLIHNVNRGKPWVCEFCSKGFDLKGNLRAHLRIHTGEKPYECDLCGETFSDTKKRKKHIALDHETVEVEEEQK